MADPDWPRIAAALAPVEVIDDPLTIKKRSRDFFWYSPILNEQLRRSFGELVVRPKTREELAHVLSVAYGGAGGSAGRRYGKLRAGGAAAWWVDWRDDGYEPNP